MNIFLRLLGRLAGWDKADEEFWQRFILPQVERALAAGVAPERVKELVTQALDESDLQIVYPGARLRDLIDRELIK